MNHERFGQYATNGFPSQESVEAKAAADALLDKDDAEDDIYCDTCGEDQFDCDCCPTGIHQSIYSPDCDCPLKDMDDKGAPVEILSDGRQLSLGTATQPTLQEFCKCPAPYPALDKAGKCVTCKLPDFQMDASTKPIPPPPPPHRNHPPTEVITGEGWSISCGKGDHVKSRVNDFDVIVNLTGRSVLESHDITIPELAKWSNGGYTCTEVMLDWPDYGIVNLPLDFWLDLLAYVEKNKLKLLVFCVGGHGRTGTAVASMLIAGLNYGGDEAINWVRKNYCERAIESKSQENYLLDLADEKAARA